jgi:hypothetical protein
MTWHDQKMTPTLGPHLKPQVLTTAIHGLCRPCDMAPEWLNGVHFTHGAAVLVGYVSTSQAERLEQMGDDDITAHAMTALRAAYPEAPDPVFAKPT